MQFDSAMDSEFLDTVATWIAADGEVFVIIHFPDRGTGPVFDRFLSVHSFKHRVSHLPPSAVVVACKGVFLDLNGVVDDAFIDAALASIPDGQAWAVVGDAILNYGIAWWSNEGTGSTQETLEAVLRSETFFGESVSAGVLPPWRDDSSETIASAKVPDPHTNKPLLSRFTLTTLLVSVSMIAVSLWLVEHVGAKAATSVPWVLAIAFLLFGREWKWRTEAIYICFVLGMPGFLAGVFSWI